MNHQDWLPIVLKNKVVPIKKETILRKKVIDNSSVILDENEEVVKIKTVPREISNLIVNARVTKKLTRKQLANQLNLKEDIIADIESGKAIYDGNQIAKIKKFLGVI